MGEADYTQMKQQAENRLIQFARRAYPNLGRQACVREMGTPKTYARFTHRPDGAVGGIRQTLANSNQSAVPHHCGVKGFHLVGDRTWPGLGTVACVLGGAVASLLDLLVAGLQAYIFTFLTATFLGLYVAPEH